MDRHALVIGLAGAIALLVGCSKQPAETPVPVPPAASQPEAQPGKKRIPNIDTLSLDEVKRYYDECMAFKDIGHPQVPYVIEDCRAIRARWDRRDMTKPSSAKRAQNLPTLK
jgi:hypothetical protein